MRYTRRACSRTAVSSRSSSCCANAMASPAIADSAITPAPIHEERYSVAFVRNNFAQNKLLKRIALSADSELVADLAVADTSGPAWGPRRFGMRRPFLLVEMGLVSFPMKTASWVSTGFTGRLESYEHGLRLQQNSPRCLDAALNFIFQSDNVACLRASAIDQRQRVFARDSGRSGRISLGKSRALHQPRCRNFPLRIESRVP